MENRRPNRKQIIAIKEDLLQAITSGLKNKDQSALSIIKLASVKTLVKTIGSNISICNINIVISADIESNTFKIKFILNSELTDKPSVSIFKESSVDLKKCGFKSIFKKEDDCYISYWNTFTGTIMSQLSSIGNIILTEYLTEPLLKEVSVKINNNANVFVNEIKLIKN